MFPEATTGPSPACCSFSAMSFRTIEKKTLVFCVLCAVRIGVTFSVAFDADAARLISSRET
jgi:hypothetical protein